MENKEMNTEKIKFYKNDTTDYRKNLKDQTLGFFCGKMTNGKSFYREVLNILTCVLKLAPIASQARHFPAKGEASHCVFASLCS